jgi:hypothetical protein
MGAVGDLIAFVAPIAAAIATAGMSIPAQMAIAAAVGGISSVVAGNDPLKGAVVSGITAGLSSAGGKYAGLALEEGGALGTKLTADLAKAVGTGVGATTGGLVTGSSLENALLSGAASGALSYYGPAIQRGIGAVGGAIGDAFDGINVLGGGTSGVNINTGGGRSNLPREASGTEPPAATVIGGGTTGVGIGGGSGITRVDVPASTVANETPVEEEPPAATVIGGGTTGGVNLSPEVRAGIAEFERNPIVSTANRVEQPTGAFLPTLDPGLIDRLSGMENYAEQPIDVTGGRTTPGIVVPDLGLGIGSITDTLPTPKLDPALTEKSTLDKLKDAYDIATVGAALLPLIPSGGGDDGTGGIGSGTGGGLTFTKSPLRPTLTGGGAGIGGVGGRYPYTPQTYGRRGGDQETEYLFFTRDPVTGQGSLQSAPAPITTAVLNQPSAPVMVVPSGNAFAEGGEVDDDMVKHLVEYHKNGGHQGPGQVKGIGSGQDDKIPAWLSDGEYVWSAQDVADLGDGSTDEGVRRLDKMRQMVRRQAGRKDVKKIAKPQKGIDRMLKAVGGLA